MKKISLIALAALAACTPKATEEMTDQKIHLITLDPGHFHAALVQKSMYEDIDSTVHIYAPDTPDLDLHMAKIEQYNNREDSPTSWNSVIYEGDDYLEKMLAEKAGNVVVLAGSNLKKTEYIAKSVEAGFHVLADKPMAINSEDYELLKEAFASAEEKGILLYDIMTERSEITTILQKELSQDAELFGTLEVGTPENPAVTKESVHHFFKYVSGSPLIRPSWFFDTKQQGEGIVDVTTHLIDLTFWECFPETVIKPEDVSLVSARRWPTVLTPADFEKVTGQTEFPDFLQSSINGGNLETYANGEINYTINGHHAKVSVIWNYQAPEGTGDTHYSIMRGTKANLVIRQGAEQNFKPTLYIEPVTDISEEDAQAAINKLLSTYDGLALEKSENGWKVLIPTKYDIGHEAHFAQVMERFIDYYKNGNMPAWEVPNMLTKYGLSTKALEIAKE
ncbi:putative oxidoreductase C-terminal domain-containing protein [Jiulongibacter sediminis]|jgi:predicted dehydrogenase|uniref:putative oxidoreductase C-terminal domain-containing protein n=1 Tax=Jiulongibacter sediminis TaxID=1605367 RepID=UPI0026ECFBA2|nr:putative oxidoreductase C-terminal domain-containing protein [Jiulongibacter sediminis]